MVLEVAEFTVEATRMTEFEAAFAEGRKAIARAAGCSAVSLQRCIETPGRYLLFVEWSSVEAHTRGFRESPDFLEWRRHVGPFFAMPPRVEHYDQVQVQVPA
jgi:heme-degrading monooxygenase HmoA